MGVGGFVRCRFIGLRSVASIILDVTPLGLAERINRFVPGAYAARLCDAAPLGLKRRV
jgi:hypothetical protein